jgi:DNA-binding NtrC family response regulator
MKILVVDDDAIVIKSCKRILEAEGLEVSTVPSADEALEMIKKYEFDLLLIDVKMPKHDGVFLMREIKKVIPDMPIIVMSGYPTPETISDVLNLGALSSFQNRFDLTNWLRPFVRFFKDLSKTPSHGSRVGIRELKVQMSKSNVK